MSNSSPAKAEVDEALARTIDSTRFDAAVRKRVARVMAENPGPEQVKAIAEANSAQSLALTTFGTRSGDHGSLTGLEAVENQIRARESDLASTEAKVRTELPRISTDGWG